MGFRSPRCLVSMGLIAVAGFGIGLQGWLPDRWVDDCCAVIVRSVQAFVDESGSPADTEGASPHFVASAVVVRDKNLNLVLPLVQAMQLDLHWPADGWKGRSTNHSRKVKATQMMGESEWLKTISVVICKRELPRSQMTPEQRYLWSLRLLLERLS